MTTPLIEASETVDAIAAPTRPRRGWRSPSLIVGSVLLLVVLALALVSLVWTPYGLDQADPAARLAGPSAQHWAGTDRLGRDQFTQLMLGARTAVWIGVSSVAVAFALGTPLGLLAAAAGRLVDDAVAGVIDIVIAFPTLLLAMLLVTVYGASTTVAISAIGIGVSAEVARLARISASRVFTQDYVLAARTCGTSTPVILIRHVLPNIWHTLLVQATLAFGVAVIAEASLSYLGLGTPPPAPSWGRMLQEAQSTVGVAPWNVLLPGLAVAVAVVGVNLLGDGLREIGDPQLRTRRRATGR
ncbi:ABC transporter permease [Planosporangium mesophilum]|uniref:Peptide ABC transporter permease n=1 Tax=Planosporangium mesophilum TaxID=689768 RepID=A0A8J3TF67_9ACTN|nr:ABC transporter permease [Planosporangium mesophilum]NJC86226.1 ABC transporter permease [Planosporangium mesophilum]GII25748.1 peptide ABC transporter permease [Planosporangium mesophilum]